MSRWLAAYHCRPLSRDLSYTEYFQTTLWIDGAELRDAIAHGRGIELAEGSGIPGEEWADAIALCPEEAEQIHSRSTRDRLMARAMAKHG